MNIYMHYIREIKMKTNKIMAFEEETQFDVNVKQIGNKNYKN